MGIGEYAMEDRKKFDTGAVRSCDADDVRYDLISPVGLRRLAETYAEGAEKYGDSNWLKGMPAKDVINHCLRHINIWMTGDRSEDHLAHAAWNLFALMHFEEIRPDLIDIDYHCGVLGCNPPREPEAAPLFASSTQVQEVFDDRVGDCATHS